MTTNELSTVVHAHTCVICGNTYRFKVGRIAADQLVGPALARVLVQVHVTVQDQPRDTPVAELFVMASLRQPAQVPLLLTDARHERLHRSAPTDSEFTTT